MKEEELRMERLMEQERSKSFKGDDEKIAMTKEQNMKHAQEIKVTEIFARIILINNSSVINIDR